MQVSSCDYYPATATEIIEISSLLGLKYFNASNNIKIAIIYAKSTV